MLRDVSVKVFITLSLFLAAITLSAQDESNKDRKKNTIEVKDAYVKLIDSIDISSSDAGLIKSINVREGAVVSEKTLLGRLENQDAINEEYKVGYNLLISQKESQNDVNVRYAVKALEVAEAELEESKKANEQTPGTVPETEIRRLTLTVKKSALQVEQSERDLVMAQITTQIREAELRIAKRKVERLDLFSSIDGQSMVVEINKKPGEWVNPGDPVFKIVRLSTLRIVGDIDLADAGPQLNGKPVTVDVTLHNQDTKSVQGKIVFVDPRINVFKKTVRVWAEIPNVNEDGSLGSLQPGLKASMKIHLDQ